KRGAAGGELRAPDVDRQIVTGRPPGSDRRAAGDGEAGAKVIALVADIGAADMPVIPPVEALDHPTGEGHGDLLVALADGRRLKLRHPLLKIRAAIAAKISGSRRRRLECEPANHQAECGCDGDAAGCFCQSPKHIHPPNCWIRVSSLMYLRFGIEEIGDWALGAVFRRLVTFPPRGISSPARRQKRASLPSRGRMELVAELRQQTDSLFNQRQKKAAPRGAASDGYAFRVLALEEDDAADLEQIPTIEALAYMVLVEAEVASGKVLGSRNADQVEIDVLVLPPRVDMHGRRVDLLHHAKAPALHFRARDKDVRSFREAGIGSTERVAEVIDVGPEGAIESVAQPTGSRIELVI